MKVVVAMSGGVDSSVAAALLKQKGYQVVGVTMCISLQVEHSSNNRCCGIDAIEDAKKVAYRLGIPHYVVDFRDVFHQKVVADFFQEYSRGRTPNPCIRCNQYIKFDLLMEKAKQLNADFIATGHHARIENGNATGRYLLRKGSDRYKDQSYFLYTMTQEQLSLTLFPVGNHTKTKVREIAGELRLPVATRPESQEICFIPGNNYTEFIRDYAPQAATPGPILSLRGETLGKHRGISFYTIGQRKGLGIAAPEPLYVVDIDHDQNTIVVGSKEETYSDELTASGLNWISIDRLEKPIRVKAKIRYRHPDAEAEITSITEGAVRVKFAKPQMAIAPGQAVVFYNGDTVIGGGTIEQAHKNRG